MRDDPPLSTLLVIGLFGISVMIGLSASLRGRASRLIEIGGFITEVRAVLTSAPRVQADETSARSV